MPKKNSPGCDCCCSDPCIGGTDDFDNLNPDYQFNGSSRFSIVNVGGISQRLCEPQGDTGSAYRVARTGGELGRRMHVEADCSTNDPVGTFTQRYGVFIGGVAAIFFSCDCVGGVFEENIEFKVYTGVDEFGGGGIEESIVEFIGISHQNHGALAIDVFYDGLTPGLYNIKVSARGTVIFEVQSTLTIGDTINFGMRGELGGSWDKFCYKMNHIASTCFPCLGCKQNPRDKFPIKWLLDFPVLDQSTARCASCSLLEGTHELVYWGSHAINAVGETDCAWEDPLIGSPCSNLVGNLPNGNLWQLSVRGLEATNGVDVLHYDQIDEFHCDGPNTFRFNCSVCKIFNPATGVDEWSCEHPETLTIYPVYPT